MFRAHHGLVTRQPRSLNSVCASSFPLVAHDLQGQIASRCLAASADGRTLAIVRRRLDSSLILILADPAVKLPSDSFDELAIIQVYPKIGVRVWGSRAGERGIWMVTSQGITLCARLDKVIRFTRGPFGDVAVGSMGRGMLKHVVDETEIVLPRDVELVFGDEDHPHTLLPYDNGPNKMWMDPPAPDRWLADDAVAGPVWPLPFKAEHARMFLHRGVPIYLLRNRGSDRFLINGQLTSIAPEGVMGTVEFVWTSSFSNAPAALLRVPGPSGSVFSRLIIGGRIVVEGEFDLKRDGFRWSPNGRHFVAHIRSKIVDSERVEESLVSGERKRSLSFAHSTTIHEPMVDDLGRLAYVIADKTGRRIVADTVVSPAYPYAWNVSIDSNAVIANAFVSGEIQRVELPFAR